MSINLNRVFFSVMFGTLMTTLTANDDLPDIIWRMGAFSVAGYLMTKDPDPYTGPESSCSCSCSCNCSYHCHKNGNGPKPIDFS